MGQSKGEHDPELHGNCILGRRCIPPDPVQCAVVHRSGLHFGMGHSCGGYHPQVCQTHPTTHMLTILANSVFLSLKSLISAFAAFVFFQEFREHKARGGGEKSCEKSSGERLYDHELGRKSTQSL